LTGRFGKRPQYWAQRMLSEGIVSILATDAHNVTSRPPLLAEGFEIAVTELGQEQAEHLVFTRPLGVLEDQDPGNLPALLEPVAPAKVSLWRRLVGVQS
jgi:protein-tyrosine phosphatase